MSVPAAKVRAICSSPEAALVRASRPPVLKQLSLAKVKQHALRARKLTDKWEDLAREQSRDRRRQTGSSDADANTALKAEIFREALTAYETRMQSLEAAAQAPAAGRSVKNKQTRGATHRSTRSAVRKALAATKLERNGTAAKPKGAATSKKAIATPQATASMAAAPIAVPRMASAAKPARKAAKPHAKAKPVRGMGNNLATAQVAPAKQLRAAAAAKQARVTKSNQAPRAIGHTTARGKRAQARRDAKN